MQLSCVTLYVCRLLSINLSPSSSKTLRKIKVLKGEAASASLSLFPTLQPALMRAVSWCDSALTSVSCDPALLSSPIHSPARWLKSKSWWWWTRADNDDDDGRADRSKRRGRDEPTGWRWSQKLPLARAEAFIVCRGACVWPYVLRLATRVPRAPESPWTVVARVTANTIHLCGLTLIGKF